MRVVLGTVILENFQLFSVVVLSQSRRLAFHTWRAAKHALEQHVYWTVGAVTFVYLCVGDSFTISNFRCTYC